MINHKDSETSDMSDEIKNALRLARSFGGMAYEANNVANGYQFGGVPATNMTAQPNPAALVANPALSNASQPPVPPFNPTPVSGGMNALNTPMNHYDTQSMGYADGGAVENALRVARLKFANGGVAEALKQTHGPHAIPLHQAIARHGYATDGAVNRRMTDEEWRQHEIARLRESTRTPKSFIGPTTQHQASTSTTPKISGDEYKKGNLGHGEYAFAYGGKVHPNIQHALRLAKHRHHFAIGGAETAAPAATPTAAPLTASPQVAAPVNLAGTQQQTAQSVQQAAPAIQQTSTPIYQDPNQAYVNSLYQNVMGRSADTEGANYWANRLASGEINQGDVLQNFAASPEFQNLYQSDPTKAVGALYSTALGRQSDQPGLDYWTGQAKQGMDLSSMVQNFLNTEEGQNASAINKLYQNYTNNVATPEQIYQAQQEIAQGKQYEDIQNAIANSPQANKNYVQNLYQSTMGRTPDQEGLQYWADQLNSGKMTADELQNALQNTQEAKNYQNNQFINNEFQGLYGRAPKPEETQSILEQLNKGASYGEIDKSLGATDESQQYQASNFTPYDVASSSKTPAPNQPRTNFQIINKLGDQVKNIYQDLSPDLQKYVAGLIGQESGGTSNPLTAKSKSSNAAGMFQFVPKTWTDQFNKVFGKNTGLSNQQILDLRTNQSPEAQAINLALGTNYMKEGAGQLQKAGLNVDPAGLYSVHFLGNPGIAKLAAKNPNAPASQAMNAQQIKQNSKIANMTAGQAMSFFGDTMVSKASLGQRVLDNYTRATGATPTTPTGSTTPAGTTQPTNQTPSAATSGMDTVDTTSYIPQPPAPVVQPIDSAISSNFVQEQLGNTTPISSGSGQNISSGSGGVSHTGHTSGVSHTVPSSHTGHTGGITHVSTPSHSSNFGVSYASDPYFGHAGVGGSGHIGGNHHTGGADPYFGHSYGTNFDPHQIHFNRNTGHFYDYSSDISYDPTRAGSKKGGRVSEDNKYASGGSVDAPFTDEEIHDLLNYPLGRHGYATDGAVEGDVAFAPDDKQFEKSGSVMAEEAPPVMPEAEASPIQHSHSWEHLPLRPYGTRYNEETHNFNTPESKDIGFYGPVSVGEGDHVASEYSRGSDIGQYPSIAADMPEDLKVQALNAARFDAPVPEEADKFAYNKAAERKAQGRSPFYEAGEDPYPKWSPNQYWEKPAIMPNNTDALKIANKVLTSKKSKVR